jgi:ribosomal protein L44E
LSSKKDEQRVPQNEHNRQQHQQRGGNVQISSHSVKLNVHSTKHNGDGSTKSKSYDDSQSHKNLSSSFGENSKQRNGPTQQQQQYQQHPHHSTAVFGNKTKNNVGHKASQTKKIQLSTAAKRCKSINRSSAVDNNNSKTINLDDICKAEDVEKEEKEVGGFGAETSDADDNYVTSHQRHNIDADTIANNSISTTQSTDSPTLVKVKTWYTESTVVALPSTSQDEMF